MSNLIGFNLNSTFLELVPSTPENVVIEVSIARNQRYAGQSVATSRNYFASLLSLTHQEYLRLI